MSRQETVNVLVGLRKQGVNLFITEDGWKIIVELMANPETEFEDQVG